MFLSFVGDLVLVEFFCRRLVECSGGALMGALLWDQLFVISFDSA